MRRTRDSSPVRCRLRSATSLKTAAISDITPSPDTVSRLRKLPSRIDSRAVSSRFSAAVSTSVVPLRGYAVLRDRPPFARVFVPRVAAPDSTVSLPQGRPFLCVRYLTGYPETRHLPGSSPEPAQCFTLAEPGHNSSAASHTVRTLWAESLQTGIRTDREGK